MKTINLFLEKFKKLQVPDESVRKEFVKIVNDKYSINIDFKDVKIQNNTVFFKAASALKQEIYFDKKNILNNLNKKFNKKLKNII